MFDLDDDGHISKDEFFKILDQVAKSKLKALPAWELRDIVDKDFVYLK